MTQVAAISSCLLRSVCVYLCVCVCVCTVTHENIWVRSTCWNLSCWNQIFWNFICTRMRLNYHDYIDKVFKKNMYKNYKSLIIVSKQSVIRVSTFDTLYALKWWFKIIIKYVLNKYLVHKYAITFASYCTFLSQSLRLAIYWIAGSSTTYNQYDEILKYSRVFEKSFANYL